MPCVTPLLVGLPGNGELAGGGAGNWELATRVALGWYQFLASAAVVGRHAGGEGGRGCGGSRRQSRGM